MQIYDLKKSYQNFRRKRSISRNIGFRLPAGRQGFLIAELKIKSDIQSRYHKSEFRNPKYQIPSNFVNLKLDLF